MIGPEARIVFTKGVRLAHIIVRLWRLWLHAGYTKMIDLLYL